MPRKLIPTGIKYAKQGGPPDNWNELQVMNMKTKCLVHQVVEVNTEEGWLIRLVDRVPQDLNSWPTERIKGKFMILRAADIGSTSHVEKNTTR